jgi:maleamate amidohydrolase
MARVWDAYLTEQDRAHVERAGHGPRGWGQRPALLLVDLYRWVFGDEPQPLLEAVERWPASCGLAGWEALPHIQRLLAAAREAGVPVVHATGLHESESGLVGWSDNPRSRAAKSGYMGGASERDARIYDIMPQVAPVAGEALVRKASPSPFFGTPLVGHLTGLGVDTLIIAGETTSGCIRASVVDACTHRYSVVVPEECVFDRHEAAHAINLFDMHHKYADVLPLTEVLAWVDAWQAPQGYATKEAAHGQA